MKSMTRWDPTRNLVSLRNQMNDLVRDFFGPEDKEPLLEFEPLVDVSETPEAITVKAEVPGMEAKDIEVKIEGDVLTLRGEKRSEREEKGKLFHRVERACGAFHRAFTLPVDVKVDAVKAVCKNGVLEVVLPKREPARTKEVKIETKA